MNTTTADIIIKALTITATNQTKCQSLATVYNLGSTAFTTVGLVGSESISGVTLTSTGTPIGVAVGSYPIIITAAVAGGSTLLTNYNIT